MKSFAKKFLSLALAAVLLLGVFPMAANAEGDNWIHYWTDETMTVAYNGGAWDQNLTNPTDSRITLDASGKYTLDTWNLPDMGEGMGWFYCAHPADQAKAGDPVVAANLFLKEIPTVTPPAGDDDVVTPPVDGDDVVTPPAAEWIRYYNEDGSEIKGWAQELTASNPDKRIAAGLAANGEYTLADWNLPAMTDNTGLNRKFLGWAYKNHPADIAAIGDKVISANLIMKFEEIEYKTVTVAGSSAKLTVKKGDRLTQTQLNTLKNAVECPVGKIVESLRYNESTRMKAGDVIDTNKTVTAYFMDDPDYNPNPDGPHKYFIVHMDENYIDGATAGKTYDAPNMIKNNQRVGLAFKSSKNELGKLPVPSRQGYVFRGWYLEGTNQKWDEETIFDLNRDITLEARWDERAEVRLEIYRNGNTKNPIDVVKLYSFAVGEYIDASELDINNYYKNNNKPFKFSGWYDRDNWVEFKAGEKAEPISGIYASDVGAVTILRCMITDTSVSSNAKPDLSNPKTGDESMIIATTAVMLVSAGALAVFFMDRKRRNG